jgi:hypothetical protein
VCNCPAILTVDDGLQEWEEMKTGGGGRWLGWDTPHNLNSMVSIFGWPGRQMCKVLKVMCSTAVVLRRLHDQM